MFKVTAAYIHALKNPHCTREDHFIANQFCCKKDARYKNFRNLIISKYYRFIFDLYRDVITIP